MLNERQTVLLI